MAKRICSVPDCTKTAHSRGWCSTHYSRWLRHGDPSVANIRAREDNPCSLLDCGRLAVANGMCARHDSNMRRYGHAVPVRDWPLIARLTEVGWDEDERGCWIWRGAKNEFGYGTIALRRRTKGAETQRVHRLMWEMHNGPIPEGQVVRHRCDVPACCNPLHLEVGTKKQNSRDMVERGRSIAYATGRYDGVCVQGRHDVTKPGTLKRVASKGKSYMTCVACDRDRKRKYQDKKKAEKAAREAAGKKAA